MIPHVITIAFGKFKGVQLGRIFIKVSVHLELILK
jgi:hypothetical protein